MTIATRRLLAAFHATGAGAGLLVLPWTSIPTSWAVRLVMLLFLAFLAASAYAAYLLGSGDTRAGRWSMGLLWIQVPYVATSLVSYTLYSPLAAIVSLTSGFSVRFSLDTSARLILLGPGDADPAAIGVNLVAVGLLWLWLRPRESPPPLPTSGGLVLR